MLNLGLLKRRLSPPQIIALSFAAAILAGALLLRLPIMHAPGQTLSFLDALFTATSAICVTGLIVVDTGSHFSRFGQALIMLLFQLGGFGILTVGVLLALASGRRVGFSERLRLQAQLNALDVGGALRLLRVLLVTVASAELLGAVLLYVRFRDLEGPQGGLFYALFHSVSAFNNAGFALYADSLVGFVADPLVSLTICALILIGGLGFFVVADLSARLGSKRRSPLSLHTKLALLSSVFLLIFGFVGVLVLEWLNPATLGGLPLLDKLLAGFFQTVTPRTAGFNTLDYAAMGLPAVLLIILLMFVGANPGSTGGGIKTVTAFVLVGNAWSVIRGKGQLHLFGRRVAAETAQRAGVLALGGVLTVGVALFFLSITEPDKDLLDLLFESVSAFATVGLSLGITGDLSASGKVIIILLMFVGRVGLLTAALALVSREGGRRLDYPAEEVIVG